MTHHTTTLGFEIEFLRSANIDRVIANVKNAGEANDKPAMSNISDQRGRYHTSFFSDRWIQAYDTSCGWEMKSHPLTDTSEVKLVMKAIRDAGGSVNRSCGLHVHVDVSHLTFPQRKRLAKAYIRHEAALESLLPMSRRGSSASYAKANRSMKPDWSVWDFFTAIDSADTEEALRRAMQTQRYAKLNLDPFASKGTWEFRGHQGTLNFKKIDAWASLIAALVNLAQSDASIPCSEASFAQMLDELISHTPAQLEQRSYRRPGEGTKTRRIWDAADDLLETRPDLFRTRGDRQILSLGPAAALIAIGTGLNLSTIRTQLSRWSMTHGHSSRVSSNAGVLRSYLVRRQRTLADRAARRAARRMGA